MPKPNRAERRKPLQEAYSRVHGPQETTPAAKTAANRPKELEIGTLAVALWRWIGKHWKWDAILSVGAFGMFKLGEYGLFIILLAVAGLAAISRLSQWDGIANLPRLTRTVRWCGYIFGCSVVLTLAVIANRVRGDQPWSNLSPKRPPVAQAAPKGLTDGNRGTFVNSLKAFVGKRDRITVSCPQSSEFDCVRAGRYLLAFSEAQWPLASNVVNRVNLAIPLDGIVVVSHFDAPKDIPIH
jgi:hypothetical protein